MAETKSGRKKSWKRNLQVNQYDKILRENMEAALPGLIRNLLNIHAVKTEEIPDDIQHTKERKPDVLKKVTDKKGESFVLHLEFQAKDEPKMAFRMAEYYIMLLRRYELPVRQYVIYIGEGIPAMTDCIYSGAMKFKYELIALSTIDYHLLLRSDNPEEKMLAILANLGDGDAKLVIEDIISQVVIASDGHFSKLRHVQQLRILAQLRNLALDKLEIMDSLAGIFKIEKDIFYKMGEKKGKEAIVKNLLLNTDFAITKIATLAEVTVDFVKKIKKSLK